MNLADQLFNSLVVVNLQDAAKLRTLTTSERSLMEQAEAKAGPMLQDFSAIKAQLEENGEHGPCLP
jgi:hypothetical protein